MQLTKEQVTVSHKPCGDSDCTYCGTTPLANARREIVILRRQKSLLHDATIALRNGMGGHNHWDDTMKRGAGCLICQEQKEARQEATKLIDQCSQMQNEIAELQQMPSDEPSQPPAQAVTLPTHEGWWWEWQANAGMGYWYPRWCEEGATTDGWQYELTNGDKHYEWVPCKPGHWLPVAIPHKPQGETK